MLEVKVDKQRGLNQLFEQLNHQNVKVISVRNKTNRLEELFVDLLRNNNPKGADNV